ncbi:hypothetical protein [Streptomyces sp. ME18-1-4]|jgi:hypothetical protein|uniref:hypothetical protein n=1 Tax=Streptomyces sp. ME18-1-4 TaxID=3028685 RepID=UPI0029B3F1C2|nr:hypothetical protein [Streptomyces sp. ME18-1-4]MDX3245200.1 hypothetical protein [Streptomyces sp. ME18-1-4]
MRKPLAAALSTVALTAGTLLGAPAAHAQSTAYPTSHFDVTYGNTYTRGTLTWYNRSIGVSGIHKSVDVNGCRMTTVFALDSAGHELAHADSGSAACEYEYAFQFTVPVDVPGVSLARVCLDQYVPATGTITYLKCVRYSRP